MTRTILYLLLTGMICVHINCQIDPDFGTGGKLITQPGYSASYGTDIKIQTDGKILLAGNGMLGDSSDFLLIRYNTDGSFDTTFGNHGITVTDFSGALDQAKAIAIQTNSKIVVAGNSRHSYLMARFDPDGSLDDTFGENGKVITGIEGTNTYNCGSLEMYPDGSFLLAGSAGYSGVVIKYKSNGGIDSTFGQDGVLPLDFGNTGDEYLDVSLAIQPDNKFVVAALSYVESYDFTVLRFTGEGKADSSFGTYGKAWTDISNLSDDRPNSIIVQPDGKIVVAGWAAVYNGECYGWDFGLARFNSDGTPDRTFGQNGTVATDFGEFWDDRPEAISLLEDGKLLVGGYRYYLEESDFALTRYNADGSTDERFGTNGLMLTDFDNSWDCGLALTIQQDDKILLAGETGNNIGIVRYIPGDDKYTSVEDKKEVLFTGIYPNPLFNDAKLIYTLSSSCRVSIGLYDLSGKELQVFLRNVNRCAGKNQESIELNSSFPPGMYLLKITSGSECVNMKILKTRE